MTKHFGPSNRRQAPAVFPLTKSSLARQSNTGKSAAAAKHAAINAFKPCDGKPLCVKAQLELHNQQVRLTKPPTNTITHTITPSEPSTDADEIELHILDKDLLLSESEPNLDTQPNQVCDQETSGKTTPAVSEVVGLSSKDIDQQIKSAFNPPTNKRKRSTSSSSSGSSSSASSSDSTTSNSSSSSCSSKSSTNKKKAKPDSSSGSASNSPKIINKKSSSSSSDGEDFCPGLSGKLDELANSLISSTTEEAQLVNQTIPQSDSTGQTVVSKPVLSGATSEQLALEILPTTASKTTEVTGKSLKLTPSGDRVSVQHYPPQRDPRLSGRVTSQSRLPKELLNRITPIAPSRPNYGAIRERVEQNLSDSLGVPFRLPRITLPAPKSHSPTFARFNPGLVYLSPRPEPVPNITINNNYYGGSLRGQFRGTRRGRGAINRGPHQTKNREAPFRLLTEAEIKLLSRGQKRRYYQKLTAHQSSSSQ